MYFEKDGVVHVHGERRDGLSVDAKHVILDNNIDGCTCDLVCVFKEDEFADNPRFEVKRFSKGRKRTEEQMYQELCVSVNISWVLEGSKLVAVNYNKAVERVEESVKQLHAPNQVTIPTYFNVIGSSTGQVLKQPKHIIHPIRIFDSIYLREQVSRKFYRDAESAYGSWANYLHKRVWQEVREGESVIIPGIPWENKGRPGAWIPSLSSLALRVASLANASMGGNHIGPYANYTLNDLARKQIIRCGKMTKPTHRLNPRGREAAPLVGGAMRLLNKMMMVEKYKDTQTFEDVEEKIKNMNIPHKSSPGRRAGPKHKIKGKWFTVIVTVNGKKILQEERSKEDILKMCRCFRERIKFRPDDRCWIITFKTEVLFGKSLAEQKKLMDKVRIYFIPTTAYYILSQLVQGFRQKVERGNVIRIGMTWNYGGANDFAEYFNYKDPDMLYYQADFSGLDTTIKFQYLMLYSYSALYYYNKGGDRKLYEYLLGEAASHLSAKVTNVFGSIWKIMFGVMPSGAYETSHGDSWIVSLIYCQYFLTVAQRHPEKEGDVIRAATELKEILISVYGDDSVLGVKRKWSKLINIFSFTDFCSEYLDMVLRDQEVFSNFLTIPNHNTGGVRKHGVTFLQRQFIDKCSVENYDFDLPRVLPYRSLRKIVQKSVYGCGDLKSIEDHILTFIGLAYDSQGTNLWAYKYTSFMYQYLCKMHKTTVTEILANYNVNSMKSIVKLMRKMNLTLDELQQGFPTHRRLMEMH
jgi:hypothetical protein